MAGLQFNKNRKRRFSILPGLRNPAGVLTVKPEN